MVVLRTTNISHLGKHVSTRAHWPHRQRSGARRGTHHRAQLSRLTHFTPRGNIRCALSAVVVDLPASCPAAPARCMAAG